MAYLAFHRYLANTNNEAWPGPSCCFDVSGTGPKALITALRASCSSASQLYTWEAICHFYKHRYYCIACIGASYRFEVTAASTNTCFTIINTTAQRTSFPQPLHPQNSHRGLWCSSNYLGHHDRPSLHESSPSHRVYHPAWSYFKRRLLQQHRRSTGNTICTAPDCISSQYCRL